MTSACSMSTSARSAPRPVRNTGLNDDSVAVPPLTRRQKGATELTVKDITISGRRYVLCRNEAEAKKDAEASAASSPA